MANETELSSQTIVYNSMQDQVNINQNLCRSEMASGVNINPNDAMGSCNNIIQEMRCHGGMEYGK